MRLARVGALGVAVVMVGFVVLLLQTDGETGVGARSGSMRSTKPADTQHSGQWPEPFSCAGVSECAPCAVIRAFWQSTMDLAVWAPACAAAGRITPPVVSAQTISAARAVRKPVKSARNRDINVS